jgi:hypothetical protein
MGFPVPFASWVRGPWRSVVSDVLLDPRTRDRGIVDAAAVGRLLAGAPAALGSQDADALWSLLNLELWYRTFIDGHGIQTLPAPNAAVRPLGPLSVDATADARRSA